jgi:hypothetical protein
VFIVLFIVGKDKKINNLSHLLTSVSELTERATKTSLGRPRGEELYKE